MAKRRDNGEGTITKLKDGRYMGRIFLGYKEDGTPNRKSVYGKTKGEAILKIQEQSLFKARGHKEPSSMPLGNWLMHWLTTYKKLKLKPKTYEVYETQIEHNIIPILGNIPLKDLSSLQIQKYINDKSQALAPATVRKQFSILNSALDKAEANELITKNPCKHTELPVLEQKGIRALTIDEENKFIEASKDDALYTLFVLGFDSGLRLGELLALTWSDIDFDRGELNVNKNIVFVKDFSKKAKTKNIIIAQDTPKTKSSIRKVPLPQRSLSLLKDLKSQTNTIMVFATRTSNYLNSRNVERSFIRIVSNAEIERCNFHTLRHTYATRLFELGTDANTVSNLLGHSKTSMTTDVYISVNPSRRSDAVKALDLLHSGALENKPIVNQLQ